MKKNKLLLFIALTFISFGVIAQTSTEPNGEGTYENPYQISGLDNLYWMIEQVNSVHNDFEGKYFQQTGNIDAAATTDWFDGKGWIPIGYFQESTWGGWNRPFRGTYDGQGYSVQNIYVNRPELDRVGFFGFLEEAVIKNLVLENVDIRGYWRIGGLVGYARESVLQNTAVIGQSVVTGEVFVGGLAGDLGGSSSVRQSFSHAQVSGQNHCGVFAGSLYGEIVNSYARGSVHKLEPTEEGWVYDGFDVGAFVGSASSVTESTIRNSYAAADISFEEPGGQDLTDKGFVGTGTEQTFSFNFFDGELSGQNVGYAATFANTAEMKTATNFIWKYWDFKSSDESGIWNIGNDRNDGYPYLDWQYPDDNPHPDADLPLAATQEPTNITHQSVQLNGEIVNTGTPAATDHGFVWSTEEAPALSDHKVQLGAVTEASSFQYELDSENYPIEPNKIYYVKTFVSTDDDQDIYGNQVSFILLPAGEGEADNPYLVESFASLVWMSEQMQDDEYFENIFFKQTTDIDAQSSHEMHEGKGWMPLGDDWSLPFKGNYDGNHHTISNLYINRPDNDHTGLFGFIGNGTVNNLGIINPDITGGNNTGAIAGTYNNPDQYISACFVKGGSVKGNSLVGGLVGRADGKIKNSYTRTHVEGSNSVGGFAGLASENVLNSYAASTLKSDNSKGGLIGTDAWGVEPDDIIINSFWDIEVSKAEESFGGIGKTTKEMQEFTTFIEVGWPFKGASANPIWNLGNNRNDDYPYLNWEYPDDEPNPGVDEPFLSYLSISDATDITLHSARLHGAFVVMGNPEPYEFGFCFNIDGNPTVNDRIVQAETLAEDYTFYADVEDLDNLNRYYFRAYAESDDGVVYSDELYFITPPEGDGSADNPYLIANINALLWIKTETDNQNDFTGKHLVQIADIDASETANWNDGAGWLSIGMIEDTFYDFTQLYGFNGLYDGQGFKIENLTTDFHTSELWDESGGHGLFGFVGPDAVLKNINLVNYTLKSYGFYAGGIAGNNLGLIENCFTSGELHGADHYSGGIVGSNLGTIESCKSSIRIVTPGPDAGGIAGYNDGIVNNSYFDGEIDAGDNGWLLRVGGIIGWLDENGILSNSYTAISFEGVEFTDYPNAGPLVGDSYDGTQINSYWNLDAYELEEQPEMFPGGRKEEELKQQATFEDWDFDAIWGIEEDVSFPYLRWENKVSLSVIAQPHQGGTVSGSGVYEPGETASLSASPNPGYYFVEWLDANDNSISTDPEYEYTIPSESSTVKGIFQLQTFTLDVQIEPEGSGTTSGQGSYEMGDSISLEANPGNGYNFLHWAEEDGMVLGSDNPMDFVMPAEDVNLVAHFVEEETQIITLSLNTEPEEGGVLKGAGEYSPGSEATVIAEPNEGYRFLSWQENDEIVSTEPSYDFIIEEDKNITAHFALNKYTLTLNSYPENNQGGAVYGGGEFEHGTEVTITASNNSGFGFLRWIDKNDISFSSFQQHTFTIESDLALTAIFEGDVYEITTTSDNDQGQTDGDGTYYWSEIVNVEADPEDGYLFLRWMDEFGNQRSVTNPYRFSARENLELTAEFMDDWNTQKSDQSLITAQAEPEYLGVVLNQGLHNDGETITLTASPNVGVDFVKWLENGEDVVDGNGNLVGAYYTFEVDGDRELTAVFGGDTYEVTLAADPEQAGTLDGDGSYHYGELVSISVDHDSEYKFIKWEQYGEQLSVTQQYEFTITGDMELIAHFDDVPTYELVLEITPEGAGNVSGEGNYREDSLAEIEAEANTGYSFLYWVEGNEVISEDMQTEVTISNDRTLIAHFEVTTFTLSYDAGENGTIEGETEQTVEQGSDGTPVEAIPDEGYHFVQWSDGVTDNPRTDENVTGDISVTAEFAINQYTLTYEAGENGTIEGDKEQTVDYGSDGTSVEAIPDEGYVFTEWDDGVTDNPRLDTEVTENITVKALFDEDDVRVDEIGTANVIIYPNPARNRFNVVSDENIKNVTIVDISGNIVYQETDLEVKEVKIDITQFNTGVYIIRIESDTITVLQKLQVLK